MSEENSVYHLRFELRHFWWMLLVLGTAWWSGAALAEELVAGKDYQLIQPPVPATGSLPEVVEVFNFKCPHCWHLHPVFTAWAEKNRQRFQIKHLPVFWGNQSDAPVRAYYAAEFMGKGAIMQETLFRAHFDQNLNIEGTSELTFMAQDLGLNPEKFQAHLQSFGVSARVAQGKSLQKAYGISGTPVVIVNGRYLVSPEHTGGNWEKMMQRVEQLAGR